MKFLAVFVALLSVAFGYQASWTLSQLSEAIDNPSTDPTVLPYLEQALNEMMAALYAGEQINAVTVTIPALDLSSWSLSQLSDALENPNTDPALVPYLENALNEIMAALVAGQPVDAVAVVVPAMDISLWTLAELSAALEDPSTNVALVPYLEHALNEMMNALFAGHQMESIVVVAPAGLLPVENPIAPLPVVPSPVEYPIAPSPVEVPVIPTPVENPAAPSSPLVQIIVNVNKGAVVAPTPVITPEPAIIPEPVIVVEQPEIVPEPVIIVDGPSVVPEPVIVVENPAIVPEPVVIGTPVLPSPVVVPEPVVIGTPILPSPVVVPEPVVIGTPVIPNPVDILHPVGVVTPVGAGAAVVGPIV